jgi:hypothetical protein
LARNYEFLWVRVVVKMRDAVEKLHHDEPFFHHAWHHLDPIKNWLQIVPQCLVVGAGSKRCSTTAGCLETARLVRVVSSGGLCSLTNLHQLP